MFLSWDSLEPAAAVSQPPGDVSDGDGRTQSPPERQNEIGGEPEHGEREPEDLAFHALDCKSFPPFTIWAGGVKENFGFLSRNPRRDGACPVSFERGKRRAASPRL